MEICEEQTDNFSTCMDEDDKPNCLDCMFNEMNAFTSENNACTEMAESGLCDSVYNCWEQECNADCGAEVMGLVACILHYAGCDNYEFGSECFPPEL